MNYLPDSSLNILKSIRYSALKTNQEKAYYALLYTQCLHKNYLPIVNDSLISLAVDYYLEDPTSENYLALADAVRGYSETYSNYTENILNRSFDRIRDIFQACYSIQIANPL